MDLYSTSSQTRLGWANASCKSVPISASQSVQPGTCITLWNHGYGLDGWCIDVPVFPPAFTGYSLQPATEIRLRLSRPGWLVLCRGGLPVERRSPTRAPAGPSVEQLCWLSPTCYHYTKWATVGWLRELLCCCSDEWCNVCGVLRDDRQLPVTVPEAAVAHSAHPPVVVRVTSDTSQDEAEHSCCTGPRTDHGGWKPANELQQQWQRLVTIRQVRQFVVELLFSRTVTGTPQSGYRVSTSLGRCWTAFAQWLQPHNPATGFRPPSVAAGLLLHGVCRRKWRLTDTDLCPCGETQTVSHIVESCPLTKLNGGLSRLHSADEDSVSWLTSYGSWHAYEKKRKWSWWVDLVSRHLSTCT